MKDRTLAILEERARSREVNADFQCDPVPSGSPLQTAQLIGALVIRFVMYAEAGQTFECFPDQDLLEAILCNTSDREKTKRHLTALLFHHAKILDLCGRPRPAQQLRVLTGKAFPEVKLLRNPDWEVAQWEIV